MTYRPFLLLAFMSSLSACWPEVPPPPDTPDASVPVDASPPDAAPDAPDAAPPAVKLGGDRPAAFYLPDDYDDAGLSPLIVFLHPYGAPAAAYASLAQSTAPLGAVLLMPNGTKDSQGRPFWNSSTACCAEPSTVDDVGYLEGLIEEAKTKLDVDPARTYLMGYSNGASMTYRLLCESSKSYAGAFAISGYTMDCELTDPVSVLHAHGTDDTTIPFEGGTMNGVPYPGVEETMRRNAVRSGCGLRSVVVGTADFNAALPGEETIQHDYPGCLGDFHVELWTVEGGTHALSPTTAGILGSLQWLLAQHR